MCIVFQIVINNYISKQIWKLHTRWFEPCDLKNKIQSAYHIPINSLVIERYYKWLVIKRRIFVNNDENRYNERTLYQLTEFTAEYQ